MLRLQVSHGQVTSRHSLAVMSPSSRPRLTFRSAIALSHTRSFWGGRRGADWSSHLDPMYQRFVRYRTLKTRAQFLDRLKRRGKFDWDLNQRPFFTPRHIRCASHFNGSGKGGPRWGRHDSDESSSTGNRDGQQEGDGYELSPKEKEWKARMELMRKRIESDPYEAIFGKRFEPFWSPLVPSWMREEMGLQSWPKQQKDTAQQPAAESSKPKPAEADPTASKPADSSNTPEQIVSTQPSSSYSAYTSTSWDSWSNKTRRTEWDSMTRQTKHFEYDPVSNRMVEVKKLQEDAVSEPEELLPANVDQAATSVPPTAVEKRTDDMRSLINTPSSEKTMQVKSEYPKTVTISTPPSKQPTHRPVGFAVSDIAPPQTEPVKESAPDASSPELELDGLTAYDLRAKMGKPTPIKHEVPATSDDPIRDEALRRYESSRVQTASGGTNSSSAKKVTEWDKAEEEVFSEANVEREVLVLQQKKAKLLKAEHGLFHIEKQKRELAKLDQRLNELAQHRITTNLTSTPVDSRVSDPRPLQALTDMLANTVLETQEMRERLETSLDRTTAVPKTESVVLQSAVERMQSKELPSAQDPDDAAAHESTELLSTPGVPKEWSSQADLLQTDRIKRTAAKRPHPMTRWIEDMEARKAEFEATKATDAAEDAAKMQKAQELEKANALLEAEVKEQKFRMQAHETRYAHKIRSLRQELETAYKQSAVHSEKHVERIQFLEAELEKANKAVGESTARPAAPADGSEKMKTMQSEGDLSTNVAKYAGSDKWYKHATAPAPPSETEIEKSAQKARDQALVKEVREIYEKEYGVIDASHRQRMFTGSEAKVSATRKPKQVVEVESDVDLGEALAEHERKQGYEYRPDNLEPELVAQQAAVDATAEKPFDYRFKTDHLEAELTEKQNDVEVAAEQKFGYRFQTDGLEAQLAAEQKAMEGAAEEIIDYGFKTDGLEAELAAQEKLAHEAQRLMEPESASNVKNGKADGVGADTVENKAITSNAADMQESAYTNQNTVEWEEPPVYKVLAYDSGNDIITKATTTANFTGTETPISISQALSQLYQPARFVPHFAELQQEGWQVIHGTRDLLVFRKVKSAHPAAKVEMAREEEWPAYGKSWRSTGIHDHGLVKPKENAMAQEAAKFYDKYHKQAVAEYDPTSIENGKLMPYENQMAQEAAEAYDRANLSSAAVNPIDGTTKASAKSTVKPVTGNYASPTGFVNLGPVVDSPLEAQSTETSKPVSSTASEAATETSQDEEIDIRHYPRVRRQEVVFSGRKLSKRERKERRRQEKRDLLEAYRMRHRRRKWRSAVRWALGVGFGAATMTYLVGSLAERVRREKKEEKDRIAVTGHPEKDGWERSLHARRGRWENDVYR